jgi:hypothetical protein
MLNVVHLERSEIQGDCEISMIELKVVMFISLYAWMASTIVLASLVFRNFWTCVLFHPN